MYLLRASFCFCVCVCVCVCMCVITTVGPCLSDHIFCVGLTSYLRNLVRLYATL